MRRRIVLLIILGVLLLAGVFTIWRTRGHNSPPIAARGGELFRNFSSLGTPFYLQRDPRWKDQTIGGSGESLGKVGCAVASLAMALHHYGVEMTPAELNQWLKTHSGYTARGWLKWESVSRVSQGKCTVELIPTPSHADLDTALKNHQPVLAKVLIRHVVPHWVLIVGKEGQEYSIRDPLGDGKSLKPLSSYGSDIYGVRIIQAGRP
ncbi:MAG TPA: C39 family peptidase [Candidatus Eisenbacteria bacterium]|nr:C39 family peptidase [Candidatus Eisenbacteria bacterium]